jgi:outer membrane protein assembly factor BamB
VDVQTGQLVWKVRDRLRFSALASVDVDQLFAVSGGSASAATLHALNPYSGQSAWTANLAPCKGFVDGAPMLTPHAVSIAMRSNRGTKLLSFDRASGAPLFAAAEEVAPNGTSWLSVDNLLIGNAPTGELVGVDATSGKVIYRHNFGQTLESDVPRRLEPVLRNGALFVPHADVHVLRPSDGKHLAKIEVSDAIADLLRVDERCDVFVAEESGHVAAFGAGPRLSLVT